MFWFQLPPATKAPRSHPSPHRGAEENGKKKKHRQKLVGRDKGSLTEQQTKGNSNNNDTDKEKTQQRTARPRELLSQTGPAPRAPEPRVSSRRARPPHQNPA